VTPTKRRALRPHHYGAAWKVAYADFTTAMMALFVVLWLLTQADVRLRQQIAQYFRQPGVLPGGAVISPNANELRSRLPGVVSRELLLARGQGEQELFESEKKAIDQTLARRPELADLRDQVIVQVTDAGLSIQVVDRGRGLLFDPSSARLKPPLVSLLKQLGRRLGRLPNRIQIGGHTESRPFPPEVATTNWELAFARANNARRVLEASGLRPRQIHRVVGYADSEPLVPEDPFADENRRLSILAERLDPLPAGPARGPIALPPDELPGRAG
jgi:chemotaxis protein MotB